MHKSKNQLWDVKGNNYTPNVVKVETIDPELNMRRILSLPEIQKADEQQSDYADDWNEFIAVKGINTIIKNITIYLYSV